EGSPEELIDLVTVEFPAACLVFQGLVEEVQEQRLGLAQAQFPGPPDGPGKAPRLLRGRAPGRRPVALPQPVEHALLACPGACPRRRGGGRGGSCGGRGDPLEGAALRVAALEEEPALVWPRLLHAGYPAGLAALGAGCGGRLGRLSFEVG